MYQAALGVGELNQALPAPLAPAGVPALWPNNGTVAPTVAPPAAIQSYVSGPLPPASGGWSQCPSAAPPASQFPSAAPPAAGATQWGGYPSHSTTYGPVGGGWSQAPSVYPPVVVSAPAGGGGQWSTPSSYYSPYGPGGTPAMSLAPNTGRQGMKLKLPTFDGTNSVEAFLAQFNVAAAGNGWGEQEKGWQLATSLRGTPSEILSHVDVQQVGGFQTLENALKLRYQMTSGVCRQQFAAKRQAVGESPQ